MPKKKSSRREENGKSMPLKRVSICSVIGSALYFIEIAAFSAAELSLSLGESVYLPVGLGAAFVSAFIAGFASLIKEKQKALPLGAFAGILQAVICDLVLVVINNGAVGKGLIFNAAVSVVGSVTGALVAANIKPKVKY